MTANGTFEVQLTPQGEPEEGRRSIAKQFHGDLEGTSTGTMLAAMGNVKGSAGYVAIEKVTGTLNGRAGSFVLQHSGTMTRGLQEQNISVVPDTGTGDLEGVAGLMTITIADGRHSYTFNYSY